MMPLPTLDTDRLHMRPLTWGDVDDYHHVVHSDPDVMRYLRGGQPMPRNYTRNMIEYFIDHAQTYGFTFMAVTDRASGAFMGHCGLHQLSDVVEVGYALGKAQRLIVEMRCRGHHDPIYIHGALERLCELYAQFGVPLGELRPANGASKEELKGKIVLAPPGCLNDRWSRRLPDPITAMASGWMRIRQRARQRNVELPLIISAHADWDELTQTLRDVAPREVWVTHGREDALIHWCGLHQIKAKELNLVGYEDEDD